MTPSEANGPTRSACITALRSVGYDGSVSMPVGDLRELTALVLALHLLTGRTPSRYPRPGVRAARPPSDVDDARYLADVLAATARWEQDVGQARLVKPLKELLWFVWQAPRLPTPRIRSKYPVDFPWSAAARDAYFEDPKCRLVIEHVEPVSLVVRDLLTNTRWDLPDLIKVLNSRLTCMVITPEEDQVLTRAGLASLPAAAGTTRYEQAGLDLDRFLPLAQDPRYRNDG